MAHGRRDAVEGQAAGIGDGCRRQGVEDVVASRYVEDHIPHLFAVLIDGKMELALEVMQVAGLIVRRLFDAVRYVAAARLRGQGADLVVFKAQDGQAFFRVELLDELLESGDDVFQRAVMVHMVGVDIGDDGDIRVLLEESPIAFISFGDDIGAFPQDGIAMQVIDFAADDDGRVLMTFFKDLAQHGRCRRLAVGTGYGNPLPPAHDMDQGIRAMDDRNTAAARFGQFHIGIADSR